MDSPTFDELVEAYSGLIGIKAQIIMDNYGSLDKEQMKRLNYARDILKKVIYSIKITGVKT